jgi:2-polyprenyl-3-methyl-5-hydroxy-6-metoxy-1,4-benzoquinol methylase
MPGGDLEPVDNCPGCGSPRQRQILGEPDSLFPNGMLRIARCDDCGLAFLNPRMTRAAIIRLEDQSEVYELDAAEREREIDARVNMLRGFAEWAPTSGRLLDVGCNRGWLLQAAQRLDWQPVGVEISPVAADKARAASGVPVYPDLADVPRDGGFDLIVAWHVLEHTADPISFLRQTRRLLARRGVLAVQVPSFDFVDSFREQGRTGSILCAVHNLYFTKSAMTETVHRAGFRLRKVINSPKDLMLTAFAGSSRWASLSRPGG